MALLSSPERWTTDVPAHMYGTLTNNTPGLFSILVPSNSLPSGRKNYVLLLTTNAGAQFVIRVIEDTVQDLSGCWQFSKVTVGINSSGLYFFRGEFLFGILGLGAIDVIMMSTCSHLWFNMSSFNPRIHKQKMKLCPPICRGPSWYLSGQKQTKIICNLRHKEWHSNSKFWASNRLYLFISSKSCCSLGIFHAITFLWSFFIFKKSIWKPSSIF